MLHNNLIIFLFTFLGLGKSTSTGVQQVIFTHFLVSGTSKNCYLCTEENKGGFNNCGDFSDTHTMSCETDCVSVSFETWGMRSRRSVVFMDSLVSGKCWVRRWRLRSTAAPPWCPPWGWGRTYARASLTSASLTRARSRMGSRTQTFMSAAAVGKSKSLSRKVDFYLF